MLREQVPQRDGEHNQAYARRLHTAYPQLTLPEISLLSGVTEGNLKRTAMFKVLPAHLAPIRGQIPQYHGEKNQAYARRLHIAHPQLTLREISMLSGVTEGNLKQDPALRALPARLAVIREQVPQRDGEKNQVYARRLYMEHPLLTLPEISLLSGVTEGNLKADPAYRALPAYLAPIREQLPQGLGETNMAYARRLHIAHPQFTLPELSMLSGVKESDLKPDPAFQMLPAHLALVREQIPQLDGENNPTYARRLHLEHPLLTLPEISLLSGVTESNLKKDRASRALPAQLAPVRQQVPRRQGERNQVYARRLHVTHPLLTLPEISLLSGVIESNLKLDPAFHELPAHLAPIRQQIPQRHDEYNQAYARRLHMAHPQLALPEISLLSGVKESDLKRDPVFRALPAHLAPIRQQVPQFQGEKNQPYARRLHIEQPQLTLPEISLLSGVTESHLKCDPAFGQKPALSTSVKPANSALHESSARRSRPLKRTVTEAAAAQQEFHEGPARSVRSRLTAEDANIDAMINELLLPDEYFMAQPQPQAPGSRGQTIGSEPAATVEMPARATPAAALLQVPPQHIEAAIAAMRRDSLTREAAEHAVGLPAGVLAAVVDAQGRWLNEPAQSDAVAGLSPAQIQAFSTTLQRMRANLSQLGTFEPVQTPPGAGPFSGPSLQESEIEDMIRELLG